MSEEVVETVEVAPEIAEKAATMGHMSKEEWTAKGRDPEKWRPADEFVKRGENILPILKERLDKQTQEMREMRDTMQQMHGYFVQAETVAERRGWERAISEILEKQRSAVEVADVDEFNRLEAKKAELINAPPKGPQPKGGPPPEFKAFLERNEWYDRDEEMTEFSDAIGFAYRKKNPSSTVQEIYAEVEKKVRKAFPEKFTNPRREGASTVEGATAPVKKAGKTFDDLPQSAKDAYHKFAKQIPNFTKADYLKNYSWD